LGAKDAVSGVFRWAVLASKQAANREIFAVGVCTRVCTIRSRPGACEQLPETNPTPAGPRVRGGANPRALSIERRLSLANAGCVRTAEVQAGSG